MPWERKLPQMQKITLCWNGLYERKKWTTRQPQIGLEPELEVGLVVGKYENSNPGKSLDNGKGEPSEVEDVVVDFDGELLVGLAVTGIKA